MKKGTGFLSGLWEGTRAADAPGPADDYWYQPYGYGWSVAGLPITADTALRIAAVYACVKVIAEDIASLPLDIYKRLDSPKGAREKAPDHPLQDVIHDQPNPFQTAFEWREMMMGHLLLRGNAYSRIIDGPRGFVHYLMPLNPDRVEPKLFPDGSGRVYYEYVNPQGFKEIIPDEFMFHVRGISSDGLKGLSVIQLARDGFGLAAATEQYGARLFSQGARPASVLSHPGALEDQDTMDRLKKNLKDFYAGLDASHGTLILEEGMTWTQVGLSNDEAQFLQTRKFQVAEIARWFRMPLHKIQDLERATFSNIEHQSIEYVTGTLNPWTRRWEQAILKDLISADRKYFAEFNLDALTRGDLKTRYDAYAIGIMNGWLAPNEVRQRENMNPREGGDEYLTPMNTRTTGAGGSDPNAPPPPDDGAPPDPNAPPPQDAPPPNAPKRARDRQPPPKKATGRVAALVSIAEDTARRVVNRELRALARPGVGLAAFEDDHLAFVRDAMKIDEASARDYCALMRGQLDGGLDALVAGAEARVARLVALALGEELV